MNLKKITAGITALAVIGGTGCPAVFADNIADSGFGREETAIEEISPEAGGVAINATNFPDATFRAYVSEKFDTDGDGVLTADEIAEITKIDVSGTYENQGNVSSLKGIEYFTALTCLECGDNQLTSLDLSKNTTLTKLDCSYNELENLDVSKNTALKSLDCSSNQLTSLDVSKNTALTKLYCEDNQLTSLDVSNNTNLTGLLCTVNQLTSLDVSNNAALKSLLCIGNQLTSLDVSKNTALTLLDCRDNKLTSLDVNNNTALKSLYCNGNQLTSLDVSNNTALTYFGCFGNTFNIGNINVSYSLSSLKGFDPAKASNWSGAEYDSTTNSLKNFASKDGGEVTYTYNCGKGYKEIFTLVYDSYTGDKTEDIAVNETNFPDATFRAYVSDNFDTDGDGALSADEIAAVKGIAVSGTYENHGNVSSLKGIEYFTALTELECSYNQLTSLDVSKNTALDYLNCSNNQLTSLDVSKNMALRLLYCDNNQLTSLDVSKNTALYELKCNDNQLTNLNASKNTALTRLDCENNRLTSLDVSKNTALTTLYCYNNQLTSLDVSNNNALTYFNCNYNKFNIGNVKGSYSLSKLKGFDPAKASNWNGAEYDSTTNSLKNFASKDGGEVTYTYDCGNNYTETFTLVYDRGDKTEDIAVNETNFPDETFRAYVSDNFDTDGDGALSPDEIAAVKGIDVSGTYENHGNVSSLKGIEYFTALTELECSYNQLTSLDVSKNTDLRRLECYCNKLTSLDVSKNTALRQLVCPYNQLTSLDVSKNTALTSLQCGANQLTSLDVSKNTALELLECSINQLKSLDVSKNTALEILHCYNNQLTSLDVSKNKARIDLSCSDNTFKIGNVKGSYSLSNLPAGFDPAKASNWSGAKYDSVAKSLKNFASKDGGEVTYTYNCGNNKSAVFTLVYDSYTAPAPEKPTVTAAAGDGSVTLNWNDMGTGVTYKVYSYNKSNNKYASVADVTGTTYTVTGLTNGKEYGYLVRAKVNGTWSSYTVNDVVYATPKGSTADKLAVTAAAGDRSVTLNWNSLGNGVKYKIYGYNGKKYTTIASDVTDTSYTVNNLKNGTEYGFLVRAYVNGAWTAYTVNDVVYATPKGSTVDKLTVTATAGDGSVTLKWNDMGAGVTYKVYSYNKSNNKYSSVADVTGTAYTVTGLTNGKEYGYLVRAKINGTWSAYTVNDVVYATPKGSTADKLAVTATAGDKSVTLSWNSLGTGVKYKVYGYNGKKYSTIASDVTDTSYTVNNLKNGTEYGFLVRAYVNGAWTAYTVNDVVYATPKGGSTSSKPAVTATAGNKQVTLNWQSMGDDVTYKIYSYNKTTNKYTAVTTVSGTSYTVTGLTNGIEYGYLVRANINGKMTSYTSDDVVYATPSE